MQDFKEIISGYCCFDFYRVGNMYYNVEIDGIIRYSFPIDISDPKEISGATFNSKEKSIFFMRYIRKAIQENTFRSIS